MEIKDLGHVEARNATPTTMVWVDARSTRMSYEANQCLKQAWMRSRSFRRSHRQIHDHVTLLCDLDNPTDLQRQVLSEADLHLTLLDLPVGAYPGHAEKLIDLVRREIRVSPLLAGTKTHLALRAALNVTAAIAGGSLLAGQPSWPAIAPVLIVAVIAFIALKRPRLGVWKPFSRPK